jgi:uncharacterized delta-60 repeat protein
MANFSPWKRKGYDFPMKRVLVIMSTVIAFAIQSTILSLGPVSSQSFLLQNAGENRTTRTGQAVNTTVYLPAIFHDYQSPEDFIVLLNQDGTRDQRFDPVGWKSGSVNTIVLQPDEMILVGGEFLSTGNAYYSIVRLDLSGNFDHSFNAHVNGSINSIALQPDGKIFIGGSFSTVDGVERNNIARLNTDGSLDMTFNPGGGTNDAVKSIAILPDGNILIGGIFTEVDGIEHNYIAQLDSIGTLNNFFDPGLIAGPGSYPYADGIYALGVKDNGKIILGGYGLNVNGTPSTPIAQLNPDGSLDPEFDSSDVEGHVDRLAIQGDGKIIMAGKFNLRDEYGVHDLMRTNSNGSLDQSFHPYKYNYSFYYSTWIHAVEIQPDGKLLVGGGIFGPYPISALSRAVLVSLNEDGIKSQYFELIMGLTSIEDIVLLANGQVLVGGSL